MIKHLLLCLISLLLLTGIYYDITLAYVIVWILYPLSTLVLLGGLWALDRSTNESLLKAKANITPFKFVTALMLSALTLYVYFITANYSLFCYATFNFALSMYFINALFNKKTY